MPLLLRPGLLSDAADFRAYPLDLCRRRDPVTGAHPVTATVAAGDYSGPSDARAFIDGTRAYRTVWIRTAGEAVDPDAAFTVEIDLGAILRIGAIEGDWFAYREPTTVAFEGSPDGTTWTTLSPAIDFRQKLYRVRTLASPEVRYLRLIGVGTRNGLIQPKCLRVLPAWDAPEPVGAPGLNVLHGCPGAAWTNETPANWNGFGLIPGTIADVRAMGLVGATGDASAILDLGRVAAVNGLVLCFGNKDNGQAGVWEHGAIVEARDADSGPWTEVADVAGPIDLDDPPALMFDDTIPVRQVRLINRRGTYGSGHPSEGLAGTGTGAIGAVELIGAGAGYTPRPIAKVALPGPRSFSAGVYDTAGRLRRTIAPGAPIAEARMVNVPWEGTDDAGTILPTDTYTVKTVHLPAVATMAAFVGNSGNPGEPFTPFISILKSAMSDPNGVAVSPDGQTVCIVGHFSEDANRVQAMTIAGDRLWQANPQRHCHCCATDGTDVWIAANKGESGPESTVERRVLATGSFHNADGSVSDGSGGGGENARFAVSAPTPDPEPTRSRPSRDGGRDAQPITALAVEVGGAKLFVANHSEGRVEVWAKDLSGAISETGLSVNHPTGLAVDPLGRGLWIAHDNTAIDLHPVDGSGVFSASIATIGSLLDPCGLAAVDMGGGSVRLFVAEAGRNRVREYEVSNLGSIAPAGTFADFGADYAPGAILDPKFAWTPMVQSGLVPQLAAVSTGGLVVVDRGNARVIRFDAAGDRVWQMFRLHETSPEFDPATIDDDTLVMTCGSFVFEVKLDGSTFDDGLGEGDWRLAANLLSTDGAFIVRQNMTPLVVRHLDVNRFNEDPPDVRTFYFQHRGDQAAQRSMTILNQDGQRSAIVGSGWTGLDDTLVAVDAAWTWADADGDGQIDALDPTTNGANGEILDYMAGWHLFGESNSVRVAANGDLWIAVCVWYGSPGFAENLVRLPLSDFDAQGNPVYRLADLETIVARSSLVGTDGTTPHVQTDLQLEDDGGFLLRTDGGGELLFRRFDDSFTEVDAWPRAIVAGTGTERAAAIQGDTSGRFVEASAGPFGFSRVMVRDASGMVLAYATPDDHLYEGNWNDHVYGLTAAKRADGSILVAVEHNYAGAIPVLRFTGLDSPGIATSTFAWAGPEAWAALSPRTFNLRRLRLGN